MASYLESHDEELDKIQIFEHIPEQELIRASHAEKDAIFEHIVAKPNKYLLMKRILIAASILVFVAFSFYKLGKHDSPEHLDNPISMEIFNNSQNPEWYVLPDSSRVKLEPQAKLSYLRNFAKDRIINQVAGEVTYFVQPNTAHPFRVINQGIQTRAVGTAFSIADYNADNLIVRLLEGKIVLEDPTNKLDNQVKLNIPTTIIINKSDFTYSHLDQKKNGYHTAWEEEKSKVSRNYPTSSIAWSNQVVNFNGVSNTDLFSIMERLYDVSIDVENPRIIDGNFTGELYQNDNLESLLTIFCQINGCTFTIKDNIIRIK